LHHHHHHHHEQLPNYQDPYHLGACFIVVVVEFFFPFIVTSGRSVWQRHCFGLILYVPKIWRTFLPVRFQRSFVHRNVHSHGPGYLELTVSEVQRKSIDFFDKLVVIGRQLAFVFVPANHTN
jgi:hypothetical protein